MVSKFNVRKSDDSLRKVLSCENIVITVRTNTFNATITVLVMSTERSMMVNVRCTGVYGLCEETTYWSSALQA